MENKGVFGLKIYRDSLWLPREASLSVVVVKGGEKRSCARKKETELSRRAGQTSRFDKWGHQISTLAIFNQPNVLGFF